ncbi:uncharacterized protein LOC129779312 [Toxorhynchites rutilus septentrionalis]|uniref:uncharacterized protein LOC129779312 n=1 Tax=Toxorhynchites rutilus septentrionalis TaxID=329112 RepID=UPI002478413B|nr:uncharacterized protein LOC129779312 [Toxorhynchites rutilus septentrionalis]
MILIAMLLLGLIISGETQTGEGCLGYSCRTYNEINTLWCHSDPTYFCQCRPTAEGTWIEQEMPCPRAETYFSFKYQACVRQEMWTPDECEKLGGSGEDVPNPEDPSDLCANPCDSYENIHRLWCYPDEPNAFCQCKPTREEGLFVAVRMPCALETVFSFQRQTCMHNIQWTDSCPD